MQLKWNLMSQTWENGRKPSFGPDFGPFWSNVVSKNVFRGFYVYLMLYMFASYHCMQFQGKIMNQTWENGKKPGFGHDFGPKLFTKIWLCQSLIMVNYHLVQYQKNIIKYWENLVTDRWRDGQTDGQAYGQEWFHGMLLD